MAGPFCETCRFYRPKARYPFGECDDPAKVIYAGGNRVTEPPEVWPRYECSNHQPAQPAQSST